jgi:hypothetical protein
MGSEADLKKSEDRHVIEHQVFFFHFHFSNVLRAIVKTGRRKMPTLCRQSIENTFYRDMELWTLNHSLV